jgi:hypothetical protein
VRDLQQDAGTVARAGVGRDRAAMGEIYEELERLLDDVAGTNAVDVSDEADSACVVLVSRVVQSLPSRHRLSPEPALPWVPL